MPTIKSIIPSGNGFSIVYNNDTSEYFGNSLEFADHIARYLMKKPEIDASGWTKSSAIVQCLMGWVEDVLKIESKRTGRGLELSVMFLEDRTFTLTNGEIKTFQFLIDALEIDRTKNKQTILPESINVIKGSREILVYTNKGGEQKHRNSFSTFLSAGSYLVNYLITNPDTNPIDTWQGKWREGLIAFFHKKPMPCGHKEYMILFSTNKLRCPTCGLHTSYKNFVVCLRDKRLSLGREEQLELNNILIKEQIAKEKIAELNEKHGKQKTKKPNPIEHKCSHKKFVKNIGYSNIFNKDRYDHELTGGKLNLAQLNDQQIRNQTIIKKFMQENRHIEIPLCIQDNLTLPLELIVSGDTLIWHCARQNIIDIKNATANKIAELYDDNEVEEFMDGW